MFVGHFNFSQSFLDELTHTTFNMNPIPVNVILLVLTGIIEARPWVTFIKLPNKYSNRQSIHI